MNYFGTNLRILRKVKNIKLSVLSNFLNVSIAYLHEIEMGRQKAPSKRLMKKISIFFDIDVAQLEVWKALDENKVIFDISERGPISEIIILLLKNKSKLTRDDIDQIANILDKQ